MEKEMSISQLVLVSRETRTVFTASFLKNAQVEKVVHRKWKLVGTKQFKCTIGTLLDE